MAEVPPSTKGKIKFRKDRKPIWEMFEGDDVFRTKFGPYEIDEFQYKPLKKNLIFKPHNYLRPRSTPKKKASSIRYSKSHIEKTETKSPDEQFEDLLKQINFKKDDFYPPPQLIQPELIKAPYVTGDGHKVYRQRAATSYSTQFKPIRGDEKAISFKPYFLTRDLEEDIQYDFSKFERTDFPHAHYANKKGLFPFLYGPPLPDVRVLQSEYNLRFKNFFPLKTPATKVIPENTPKFLQYLT